MPLSSAASKKVKVEEPSPEDAIAILKGLQDKYEAHHKVNYTEEAITGAVKLSSRYLTDRYLPDKAIDIIDEAGAKARISTMTRPPAIKDLEKNIDTILKSKTEAIAEQDFEKAAALRDEEKAAKKELDDTIVNWKAESEEKIVDVDGEDVMSVVSKWTGVPLQRMEKKEAGKLLQMEEELKKQVIGQDPAVEAISKALRRSRADLKDP